MTLDRKDPPHLDCVLAQASDFTGTCGCFSAYEVGTCTCRPPDPEAGRQQWFSPRAVLTAGSKHCGRPMGWAGAVPFCTGSWQF